MKNQLNNKKVWLFKEKITKSSITFSENKPNSKNIKIGVSSFKTSKYETLSAWRDENQTQFKPNTNPIPERPKMNIRNAIKMNYKKFPACRGKKTNPIQTQANPIPLSIAVTATLIIDECLHPAYNHSDNF